MGASLRALLRSGALLLVGLAFGATFVLLGIAGVTLRAQCDGEWSLTGCVVPETATVTAVVEAAAAPEPGTTHTRDPIPQLSGRDRVLQTANGWIGETFSELAAMPQRGAGAVGAPDTVPVGADVSPAVAASAADEIESPAVIARRTVTSVAVDPTGNPIWPATSAAADAAEAQAVPARQAGDDETAVAAYAPVPQVRPEGLGTTEPAAAARDTRTILGRGANVRSGPSRSNGTKFILSAGEEVTVLGEDRGWLQIRDEEGRTGWAYSNLISRN